MDLCRRCREKETGYNTHYCNDCYDYIRRVMIITVTPECVLDLLTRNCKVKIEGVPDDCEFVSVDYSMYIRAFEVVVRHPSFEIIQEGCEYKRLDHITITMLED